MRQGDGTDLLGPSDPRSASIGVIYVAQDDDRQSVLTAILTQDKLGFKQVIVVLPDQNRAFQRPVDFEGLKNMRRGLKAEIVFIAPSGPGPAEYARQRRFPVYSSLEAFSQSIWLATVASGTTRGSSAKRGLFGLGRKQEIAGGVAVANVLGSEALEVNTSTSPRNGTTDSLTHSHSPNLDQEANRTKEKNGSNGKHTNTTDTARSVAGAGLVAFGESETGNPTLEHDDRVSHEQSELDGEPKAHESL
ncbi:MAG TPA: hypothetical protein VE843_13310, partial [Ktedonobacteraceae bacterium]|nr:hypothetical protein [Ktedonobacteraceae bacterium]